MEGDVAVGSRDYKEATAKYEGKCFSCGEIVSKGKRCFLAPPNGRRYWGVCCFACAEERGWVVKPENTYDDGPQVSPESLWWTRYG
jgi:hypothetical protein